MPEYKIPLRNLQKVEFNENPNVCNVAFTEYKGAGTNVLLITGVPAGAGIMLGACTSGTFFQVPSQPEIEQPEPIVFVNCTTPKAQGVGTGIDLAQYSGRIELREFL